MSQETQIATDDGDVDDERPAPLLSVLVPAKDEVGSLRQLVAEVREALDGDDALRGRWELILIDDGSEDGSWGVMEELAEDHGPVSALRFRTNRGKSAALAAGLELARGEIIATMDGDLQDDPAELPGMVARLEDGVDLVAGHKAERRDPLTKTLPSKLFNLVTSLVTGLRLRDHNCGLKVGRRDAFESVPLYGEMHRFLAAICHAEGYAVEEYSVNHRPRIHGRSKFGLERYARGGLDLITVITLTRYSRRPAHLFGGAGILFGVAGFGILAYLTGLWLLTDQAIGGRPLLLFGVLFMVLSVQLVSLGVLAELLVNREAVRENPLRHAVDRAPPPKV